MKNALLTIANALPTVEGTVNLNDTEALGEIGDKAIGVLNAGASITFKGGIIIMVILLLVAIILLACANAAKRPEMKDRLLVAAICSILIFGVVSYMTLAQNVGSDLFSTGTEQTQDDGSGG